MNFKRASTISFAAFSFFISSCKSGVYSSNELLQELNKYCTSRGQVSLDKTQAYSRLESFFSPSLKTCVQIQVKSDDKYWQYEVLDITHGFLNAPKLIKSPYPLQVSHYEYGRFAHASAEGYWKEMDDSPGKKLVSNIAVNLRCDRDERLCKESQASIFGGLVSANLVEYKVSSWTSGNIVADNDDDNLNKCPLGHRLTVDFKSNSVVVVDYPTTSSDKPECKAVNSASSYTLQGGSIGIMGDNSIFSCSKDGINNAVTTKVNALSGDVIEQPYSDYLNDGSGGPAATNKTPAHLFTQADCEKALDRKLEELKTE
ncbi:MAG: hypothetical protein WCA10_10250 [Terracidiphilus sp.]